jgi:Ca-activated chloride channel homolog
MLVAASTGIAASVRFETRVDLVVLDVCATDHSGRPAQIEADDLAVFDDGIRQQIALFLPGDRVPLAVTLLVDSSQSMRRGLLDQATAAATALINELPADSLVEVMSFNDHTAVLYPMGSDRREAALALTEVSPIGATALYEAVLVAIREQQRDRRELRESYREVIVVLTDGENTAGRVDFDEVLDEARRSGILVYPIVLPPHDAPASGPPWRMTQLALDTGGKTVAARRADDLTGIYEQIAADVRNLYRVAYVPSPLVRDGAWHRVQVRAIANDVVLRTRSGYYAPSP